MNEKSHAGKLALKCEQIKELARKQNNCTLTLLPAHQNPYRDISQKKLELVENRVRQSLKQAIYQFDIPVILSAGKNVIPSMSTQYIQIDSHRKSVWRFLIKDKTWIDDNWQLFSGDFPRGRDSNRSINLFLTFNEDSLKTLVSAWYDPDVLLNPSVASSPRMIAEIKKSLSPGTLAFSVSLLRLNSCQLFFHPSDIDSAFEVIFKAAKKSKYWKDVRS